MIELVIEQCLEIHRDNIYEKAIQDIIAAVMVERTSMHLKLEKISLLTRILSNAAMWASCDRKYLISEETSSVQIAEELQLF